jgi:hypothetical protein
MNWINQKKKFNHNKPQISNKNIYLIGKSKMIEQVYLIGKMIEQVYLIGKMIEQVYLIGKMIEQVYLIGKMIE